MICNLIDKDYYIAKVYNEYINFDIYDTSEVKDFIYKIYDKLLKKNKFFLQRLFRYAKIKTRCVEESHSVLWRVS